MPKYKNIGCIADFSSDIASKAYEKLASIYPDLKDANSMDDHYDLIIALGGDGLMLKVMHRFIEKGVPIFGMNRGSIGFLMNSYSEEDLMARIESAENCNLYPLEMIVKTLDGEQKSALAINEVALLRQTNQAAKIKISVDDALRLEALVADGILISTPAGSTAYNFAANGPIVPLDSNILPLTPISPFRPRRWRGALLSHTNKVKFEILNPNKRPVSATADFHEFRDVVSVEVSERRDMPIHLLFDNNSTFAERIITEQFTSS